jgi:hypothetical protein
MSLITILLAFSFPCFRSIVSLLFPWLAFALWVWRALLFWYLAHLPKEGTWMAGKKETMASIQTTAYTAPVGREREIAFCPEWSFGGSGGATSRLVA